MNGDIIKILNDKENIKVITDIFCTISSNRTLKEIEQEFNINYNTLKLWERQSRNYFKVYNYIMLLYFKRVSHKKSLWFIKKYSLSIDNDLKNISAQFEMPFVRIKGFQESDKKWKRDLVSILLNHNKLLFNFQVFTIKKILKKHKEV